MSTLGTNGILQGSHLYCVVNCHENAYIAKIRKNGTLPKYERKNVSYVPTNEREKFSQISPIFSNNESDYVEKLPFQPLPPKVAKKKKRGRSKNKEETVSSPKHISPIMVVPNEHESKIIEDDPLNCIHYYLDVKSIGTIEEDYVMPVTYCDDHDWENNTTYDLENLFGTNFENDDIDNCYTVGNIHVSSNHNVENPKLGDDGFENPFGIESHDDLFTKIYAWKDDYPLAYDDIMPPIFDDYCDDNYAIKNDFNHPYETRHNYYSPTEHHLSNIQLVYHVQDLYDSPIVYHGYPLA